MLKQIIQKSISITKNFVSTDKVSFEKFQKELNDFEENIRVYDASYIGNKNYGELRGLSLYFIKVLKKHIKDSSWDMDKILETFKKIDSEQDPKNKTKSDNEINIEKFNNFEVNSSGSKKLLELIMNFCNNSSLPLFQIAYANVNIAFINNRLAETKTNLAKVCKEKLEQHGQKPPKKIDHENNIPVNNNSTTNILTTLDNTNTNHPYKKELDLLKSYSGRLKECDEYFDYSGDLAISDDRIVAYKKTVILINNELRSMASELAKTYDTLEQSNIRKANEMNQKSLAIQNANRDLLILRSSYSLMTKEGKAIRPYKELIDALKLNEEEIDYFKAVWNIVDHSIEIKNAGSNSWTDALNKAKRVVQFTLNTVINPVNNAFKLAKLNEWLEGKMEERIEEIKTQRKQLKDEKKQLHAELSKQATLAEQVQEVKSTTDELIKNVDTVIKGKITTSLHQSLIENIDNVITNTDSIFTKLLALVNKSYSNRHALISKLKTQRQALQTTNLEKIDINKFNNAFETIFTKLNTKKSAESTECLRDITDILETVINNSAPVPRAALTA